MNLLYDQTFVGRELFDIDFDYDKCMQEPFHTELYNIFRRAKIDDGDARNFELTFDVYLHAAYKACGYMTLDLDLYGPRTCRDLFTIGLRYLCLANEDDDYIDWSKFGPNNEPDDHRLFSPAEVFLIEHLAYALLVAKEGPSVPYQLIEVFEDHLTMPADITECLEIFCAMRELNPNPHGADVEWLRSEWAPISHQLYGPIKEVANRYNRKVTIDTQLHAYDIDGLSAWDSEDLTPWLCLPFQSIGHEQITQHHDYDADMARRFLLLWDDYGERSYAVELIEAWSKDNLDSFKPSHHSPRRRKVGDPISADLAFMEPRSLGPTAKEQEEARARAIDDLYDYIEQLHHEENDENIDLECHEATTASAPIATPIHLNLTGKEGLTKINVIRIFNIMHHIGFFVDADGMPLPKSTLFTALSNAFNCPELSDWENSLYPSRSKANSDHRAQKKIFEKMKNKQTKFFKEMEEEYLEIFNRLQEEQETILNKSDEKKSKQR